MLENLTEVPGHGLRAIELNEPTESEYPYQAQEYASMKVFSEGELRDGLIDYSYDTNPDLLARANFFYFSPDGKMAMAYYDSGGLVRRGCGGLR
jgi:hypothetical protein